MKRNSLLVIPGNRRVNICYVLLRGTYWANYATGLGASIHELGHCFDLAHTPKGIMARGFDDMNCVFTMWRQPTSPEKDTVTVEKSGQGRKFPMYNISWIIFLISPNNCAFQEAWNFHICFFYILPFPALLSKSYKLCSATQKLSGWDVFAYHKHVSVLLFFFVLFFTSIE